MNFILRFQAAIALHNSSNESFLSLFLSPFLSFLFSTTFLLPPSLGISSANGLNEGQQQSLSDSQCCVINVIE